jgi:putative transposase
MFVAERFIANLIKIYGKYPVSTDGGTSYPLQACRFLKLNHHLHSSLEKSIIIERTMQYIKDRTKESFDDYFPCKRKKCKLKYVNNWLKLFVVDYHNKELNLK